MSVEICISENVLQIERIQSDQLSKINFGTCVHHVYNPLIYANETHEYFVKTYCSNTKEVLFLGMNPGPFGMAQNGVPFGDSNYVKNWLKIKGTVYKPENEHPKRQVQGLNCSRSEVSGSRFWSFLEEVSGSPEAFFEKCYVHNYCPISLMTSTAKNITPADLKGPEKKMLVEICDESLHRIISLLKVRFIVGIGKFAEDRAKRVISAFNIPGVAVLGIMHPSPINPKANKGWKPIVYTELENAGILSYMR